MMRKLPVGGLSQRSSRGNVCQAKRVAPPIVPESANQHHRHSGSSFDSGASTESSGGYCSGSGSGSGSASLANSSQATPSSSSSLSSASSTSSSSAWTSDQRTSIAFDDPFHREGEPLYSGRNLTSPLGTSSIFTFPAAPNAAAYGGPIGNRCGGSQPSSPHSCTTNMNAVNAGGPVPLLGHASSYIHQMSMEDQGIDLTQSPGRESPSSSTGSSTNSVGLKSINSVTNGNGTILPGCRHSTTSTTSLDSGRASTYDHNLRHGSSSSSSSTSTSNGQPGSALANQHRFSGHSYESCLRNSYHSSSSSLGSAGKSDDIHRLNVNEMLSQGVPEHEILNAWLTDLGFDEYYDLFVQSGYDMHTITRMTPEDLTAIGIQKPNHRKKMKAEIALLQLPDGLPDFIPDTLEEWLALLGLAEYSPSLRRQGYRTVEDVTQLTWEDLEDFGILRLGHQKKITLAIKRVKDILAGKYVAVPAPETPGSSSGSCCYVTHEVSISASNVVSPSSLATSGDHHEMSTFHQYRSSHYAIPPAVMRPNYLPQLQQQQQQYVYQQQQQPIYHQQHQQQQQQPIYYQYQQPMYKPDVVAIQVHRNRSSEDLRIGQGVVGSGDRESMLPSGGHQTFYVKPGWRQRSYEDGDITPVSEHAPYAQAVPGGGTLPRPRTVKCRPVAKVTAKTRVEGPQVRSDCCGDVNDVVDTTKLLYGTLGKKNPPPAPPKRSSSGGGTDEESPIYQRHLPVPGSSCKSSPLSLPPPPPPLDAASLSLLSYSDDSADDFPPPPAPITASDSYLQHGQASAAASVRERLDNILQRSGAGHWPQRSQQPQQPQQPQLYASSAQSINNHTPSRQSHSNISSLKMVSTRERECSPCESNDASDAEPGSPAVEFRQRRNGSDASFKSTSSTESDSMPFANDNAGTIKQRSVRTHPALAALSYSTTHSALSPALSRRTSSANIGGSDVLNDIGNMLADLTDELDSMLEEESNQLLKQKS